MKKITLLFLVSSVLFISANAQIGKGQKMLGGQLTFSSEKETVAFGGELKTTNFQVAPEIGFGFSTNWIVGVGLLYSHTTQELDATQDKDIINIMGAGAFVRKFHPFTENVGIFGELRGAFGFGKAKTEDADGNEFDKRDANTAAVSLSPGFYFKPTKRLIFEANFGGLSYNSTTIKPDGGPSDEKVTNTAFNFNLASAISLSFRVIL